MKHFRLLTLSALAALLVLAVGCSKIDGTVSGNQAPEVSFVNNQQDADSARQSYNIPNYTFIFPDSLQGFGEALGGKFPSQLDVEAKFELIRYQFFFVASITSITAELPGHPDSTQVVPVENYRLDDNIHRYLWLKHTAGFRWRLGWNYIINGVFEYVPVYSYAPMIFWRGSDPDGFIEGYRYLDYPYETEAELAAFIQRVDENDASLADTTEDLHWIETLNTQAVINLTTALGQIQKHVVFLQAIDNNGEYSPAARRVFNRSNRAPNTPSMAYYKDGYTRVSQPGEYERHIIGWEDIETDGNYITTLKDSVSSYYEIPMASEQLENWRGVRFLVSGDDPDDQALVTIPLQFQFLLNRIPEEWVSEYMDPASLEDDGWAALLDSTSIVLSEDNTADFDLHRFDADSWSQHNQIELFNLPTGFYQLTVFSRDDGYESCANPSWMRFKVQQMSMDKDILVIDYTPSNAASAMASLGYETDAEYMAYYRTLIEEAMPDVKRLAPLSPVNGYEVVWKDQVADGALYNCRYWKAGTETFAGGGYPTQLPLSVISQYHTVICLDDKWASNSGSGQSGVAGDWIRNPAKGFLMDYLDMGGSVFWTGYSSLFGTFNYSRTDVATTTDAAVAGNAGDFLSRYMGILAVYGDNLRTYFNDGRLDGLTVGLPEFQGQSPLLPDTTRIQAIRGASSSYNGFYTFNSSFPYRPNPADSALVFVEAYALNEDLGTIAAYTYGSYSADLPTHQVFPFFLVAGQANLPEIFHRATDEGGPLYPAYSSNPDATGCWLYIPTAAFSYYGMQITDAIDVWNVSRPDSMWAEPFLVTTGLTSDGNTKVFIRVNHQSISNPADYWEVGDHVNVDAIWQPILRKHRKPLILYTENQAYQGNFGGFNFAPYYTNFRTAFSGMPLHLTQLGTMPNYPLSDSGSGARSVMSGVLFQFFLPKLQELEMY